MVPQFVYVIQAVEDPGHIKIGWTRNPEQRLGLLDRTTPGGIVVWAVIEGDRETERWLHDRWAHIRVHGEWYEDDEDLIDQAIEGRLLVGAK